MSLNHRRAARLILRGVEQLELRDMLGAHSFLAAIAAGTTVSVGTLSGTLASTGYSEAHSTLRRH